MNLLIDPAPSGSNCQKNRLNQMNPVEQLLTGPSGEWEWRAGVTKGRGDGETGRRRVGMG